MRLRPLLKKHERILREIGKLEAELALVHAKIAIAARYPERKPRRPLLQAADLVRDVVKVLRESEHPLPPREVASRLGLSVADTQNRLAVACSMKLVVRLRHGMYQVAAVVPPLGGQP